MAKTFRVKSRVWLYPGEAAWYFVNVDKKQSERIREMQAGKMRRGFGSVHVKATIGKTTWSTSIFPDKQSGTYLLPLKAAVRRAEGLDTGDPIAFILEI
ncbi:MAG: DUF1905 domain-containing protein [Candidatus Kaiserbacteria bacterium]|nr:MAG: DUF1905 domain-containing protein [Candidatus Kaiserbacteria bacterium]